MGECEHKWVHLETIKEKPRSIPNSSGTLGWERMDRFYCEKCLEIKEIKKTASYWEDKPNWF